MIKVTPETQLDGLAQKLKELSHQLAVIYDISMDLDIYAGWYDDPDPIWGSPPTKQRLINCSKRLREAYMGMALNTGLDPCSLFEETKQKRQLMARSVTDIEMPDFQDD
jgi:hypothetical protein